MNVEMNMKNVWISKVRNVLMLVAVIGLAFLILAELLVLYCITSIIPLFNSLVLRISVIFIFTSISVALSIIGIHLLIDGSISAWNVKNKLKLVKSGG